MYIDIDIDIDIEIDIDIDIRYQISDIDIEESYLYLHIYISIYFLWPSGKSPSINRGHPALTSRLAPPVKVVGLRRR